MLPTFAPEHCSRFPLRRGASGRRDRVSDCDSPRPLFHQPILSQSGQGRPPSPASRAIQATPEFLQRVAAFRRTRLEQDQPPTPIGSHSPARRPWRGRARRNSRGFAASWQRPFRIQGSKRRRHCAIPRGGVRLTTRPWVRLPTRPNIRWKRQVSASPRSRHPAPAFPRPPWRATPCRSGPGLGRLLAPDGVGAVL